MNTVKEAEAPKLPRWSIVEKISHSRYGKGYLRRNIFDLRKVATGAIPADRISRMFLFYETPEGHAHWSGIGFRGEKLNDVHRVRLLEMADELQAYLDTVEGGA